MSTITPRPLSAFILLVAAALTGCASTSSTIAFTPKEVKLIPATAMEKVLSPANEDEVIMIRAVGFPHDMEVKRLEVREYLIAADTPSGKEVKVAISDITGIKRTRIFKQSATSTNAAGGTGVAVGEALIYAPLIPVAIVSRPFLRAMGLDEEKNSNERGKALLVYGGMTKDALKVSLGAPLQRHFCVNDDPQSKFEIWSYKKELVLSGGEMLFLNPDKGTVFFASSRFPSMKNCSPMPMN
jgi:hypothetical protein